MRIASLKAMLCAVFMSGLVVYLSGCVEPVNLAMFAGDKSVADLIDKGSGAVNITLDSDTGLAVGNRRISGLDPLKYYMIEEWHENRSFLGVQFVSPSGERSEKVGDIGSVTGGAVTGLTNDYHYRIRAAEPLLNYNVPFNVLTSPGAVHPPAANEGGAITLDGPDDDSTIVYTLTPPTLPAPFPPYEIAEVSITPTGSAPRPLQRSGNNILTLIQKDTVIDYVFFGNISTATSNTFTLYVLRVNSKPGPVEVKPGAVITVTLAFTPDNSPQPEPTGMSHSRSTPNPGPLTFKINDPDSYTDFVWYVDGTQVSTASTFDLNFADEQYKILGTYTITVEAQKEIDGISIPYAATIEVTVTE